MKKVKIEFDYSLMEIMRIAIFVFVVVKLYELIDAASDLIILLVKLIYSIILN